MSENSNNFGRPNKPRSKKLNPRIDLTAMVSISFLLIAFYMVSVELAKPRIMDLGLPSKFNYGGCGGVCGGSFYRTVTLLLDDNNKIISYHGLLDMPEDKLKILSYGKNGIRKELLNKNRALKKVLGDKNGLIVIIKPSKKSNFGNLVSILDEMAITKIQTYVIINDFTPKEHNLLALN